MTIYLVDNSAWQRVPLSPTVAAATRHAGRFGNRLAICSPSLDEASFSARSLDDLLIIRQRLTDGSTMLDTTPAVDGIVRRIREGLFAAGKGRAAGVIDVAIAAVAVLHGAVVLHYDSDFDHIAEVADDFRHEWVVPCGTVS